MVDKKRIHIFYRYMGADVQFAFDETFQGPIRHENFDLVCGVMKDDDATIVVVMHTLTREELMRTIIDKW
jgi:hypothetical protein